RRNLIMGELSKIINVPIETIDIDVSAMRDIELTQRKQQISAAAQQLQSDIEKDPDNYITLINTFEQEVEKIEKKFNKSIVGVNYQLNRYEDIQKLRAQNSAEQNFATFKFKFFKDFADSLDGGMPYTRSCLIYAGGRANSGK